MNNVASNRIEAKKNKLVMPVVKWVGGKRQLFNEIETMLPSAYVLSENGKSMLRMSYVNREIYLIQKILEHKTFHDALKMWLDYAVPPNKAQIISIMQTNGLYKVGSKNEEASTFDRRASSIRGWIEWILSIIE